MNLTSSSTKTQAEKRVFLCYSCVLLMLSFSEARCNLEWGLQSAESEYVSERCLSLVASLLLGFLRREKNRGKCSS